MELSIDIRMLVITDQPDNLHTFTKILLPKEKIETIPKDRNLIIMEVDLKNLVKISEKIINYAKKYNKQQDENYLFCTERINGLSFDNKVINPNILFTFCLLKNSDKCSHWTKWVQWANILLYLTDNPQTFSSFQALGVPKIIIMGSPTEASYFSKMENVWPVFMPFKETLEARLRYNHAENNNMLAGFLNFRETLQNIIMGKDLSIMERNFEHDLKFLQDPRLLMNRAGRLSKILGNKKYYDQIYETIQKNYGEYDFITLAKCYNCMVKNTNQFDSRFPVLQLVQELHAKIEGLVDSIDGRELPPYQAVLGLLVLFELEKPQETSWNLQLVEKYLRGLGRSNGWDYFFKPENYCQLVKLFQFLHNYLSEKKLRNLFWPILIARFRMVERCISSPEDYQQDQMDLIYYYCLLLKYYLASHHYEYYEILTYFLSDLLQRASDELADRSLDLLEKNYEWFVNPNNDLISLEICFLELNNNPL
jgi:hypothetical protein